MEELKRRLRAMAGRIAANNVHRQRECFNLIPSETTPSLIVRLCEICDPAGRYAEHRSMRGEEVYFYQGTDFIREVEQEVKAELCRFFSASLAEVRPISGQMANEIVFKSVVRHLNATRGGQRRMRSVMNNNLGLGGHLSAQPFGALFNFVEVDPDTGKARVVNFPVREDNPYRIDAAAMVELIESRRPDLIIFGKSMFIEPEPVREAADAIRGLDPAPLLMFDMAHVLGLYGAFQAPLAEGADIVTGSTHKTFFGPQRGVVVSDLDPGSPRGALWKEIVGRAFPGSTSNHHLGTLLALLIATCEMNAFREEYPPAVIRNARAFARALADAGIAVEGDPSRGYTQTHQVLLRVDEHGDGVEIARRLEQNGIVTNYQALPGDEGFLAPSGIRTGVQEMTRFGMEEADFGPLADLVADVVVRARDVRAEVARYRERFREMRFTLPAEDAARIGAEVLVSTFPDAAYAARFAENLVEAAKGR